MLGTMDLKIFEIGRCFIPDGYELPGREIASALLTCRD